jgi:hypothetical protein
MSHRQQRLSLEIYLHDVTASLGWFDKFRKRNELKNITMLGEAVTIGTPKTMLQALEDNPPLKPEKHFFLPFEKHLEQICPSPFGLQRLTHLQEKLGHPI